MAMSLNNVAGLPFETVPVLPKTTDTNTGGEQADKSLEFVQPQPPTYGYCPKLRVELSREATIGTYDGGTTINLTKTRYVAVRVMGSIDFVLTNEDKAFALSTAEDQS